MWDYTDKVRDHFLNPRNVGAMDHADGVGEEGSMACGDALKLMFRVDDQGRIADVKFQTFGCASAIASASALTEMVKGKTLAEAEKVTNRDIAAYLGGLPAQKMHCSVLGQEALAAAIRNYRQKTGQTPPPPPAPEDRIVCNCFGVTEKEIRRVARENNLKTVDDVTHYTKAGGGCGSCRDDIQAILNDLLGAQPAPIKPPKPRLTTLEKIKRIEETLAQEIRPALQQDGGDIKLVDVDGNRVLISFLAACAGCPVAAFTKKEIVEAKLREFVSDDLVVEEVKP